MAVCVTKFLILACQVVLSDGSATVNLRFFREGQPIPWFRQKEAIAAWAVALLGTLTATRPLAKLVPVGVESE